MLQDAEVAHFFWHGPALSLYERACIGSFVDAGFRVNVWSFQSVDGLPVGVLSNDAVEILPVSDVNRYTRQGKRASIVAFTDFFRYQLLQRHRGWWFDTDVLCLKRQMDFGCFRQAVVAGSESNEVANGAVLKFNDAALAGELKARADEIARIGGDAFEWGAVGPALLTQFLRERSLLSQLAPTQDFYPIHWKRADWALDPAKLEQATALCQEAYVYHIWNEVLRDLRIPKNLMPPAGSFLHQRFIAVAPELAGLPTLPVETLRALVAHAGPPPEMGFIHHLRQLAPAAVKAVKKRFAGRR